VPGALPSDYKAGHSPPSGVDVKDLMPLLCHVHDWCAKAQLCLYSFMFDKHHFRKMCEKYFFVTAAMAVSL
jgi:hypothetical protein